MPSSPFPPLDLSADEHAQLQATAMALVDDVQTMYETHLWRDHSKIDKAKWSLTRTKEDVRVYNDRRPGAGTDNMDMHLLLTVGTVLGDLHDAMYGVLNHTANDKRIKTAYVDPTLVDSAVLETIVSPTADDPFQSTTVRWHVRDLPFVARAMTKCPDNVFLEATGMRRLRNGERVGFHLMHSVAFRKAPVLPQYNRLNASVCTLWRQATPERVEAFMRSYVEIKDSFLAPMTLKSIADSFVSLAKVVACAQRKKLAHLVRHKPRPLASDVADDCTVCKSRSRRGTTLACAICGLAICKKCRLKRELAFVAPDGQLVKHATRFCFSCVTTANLLDAAVVAQAEVPKVGTTRTSSFDVGSIAPTASSICSDASDYEDLYQVEV